MKPSYHRLGEMERREENAPVPPELAISARLNFRGENHGENRKTKLFTLLLWAALLAILFHPQGGGTVRGVVILPAESEPTDTAEQSETAKELAGGYPIGSGRPPRFRGRKELPGPGGNPALQESPGKFVQKITKWRFTPGKSRVIIELHGVRKGEFRISVLERLPSHGRRIYRR